MATPQIPPPPGLGPLLPKLPPLDDTLGAILVATFFTVLSVTAHDRLYTYLTILRQATRLDAPPNIPVLQGILDGPMVPEDMGTRSHVGITRMHHIYAARRSSFRPFIRTLELLSTVCTMHGRCVILRSSFLMRSSGRELAATITWSRTTSIQQSWQPHLSGVYDFTVPGCLSI